MQHYCQQIKVEDSLKPTRVAPFKELTRKSNILGQQAEKVKRFSIPNRKSVQESSPPRQPEPTYTQGCQTNEQQNTFYLSRYAANDVCRKDKECVIYSFLDYVLNTTLHPKPRTEMRSKSKKRRCNHTYESESCKTCEKVVDSIVKAVFKDQIDEAKTEIKLTNNVNNQQPISHKNLQTTNLKKSKKSSKLNRKLTPFASCTDSPSEHQANLYNVPETELEHQENLLDYISKTLNRLTNDRDEEKKTLEELKEENLKFMYNMKLNDELEQKMKCRSELSRSYVSYAGSKETFLTCYSCIPDSPYTTSEFSPPPKPGNYQNKLQNSMYHSTLCNECNWKFQNYVGNHTKRHYYNRGYDGHTNLWLPQNRIEEPKARRICSHKSTCYKCSKHRNSNNHELNRVSELKKNEQPINSHDFTVLFKDHIDYFPPAKKQVDYNKQGIKPSASDSNNSILSPNYYSSQDHPSYHYNMKPINVENDFKKTNNDIPKLLKNVIGAPRKLGELKTTCTQTNEPKNDYDNNNNNNNNRRPVNVPINKENNLRTSLDNIVNHLVSDQNLEKLFKERLTVYIRDLIKTRFNENKASLPSCRNEEIPVSTVSPLQDTSHCTNDSQKHPNISNLDNMKADQCTQSEKRDSFVVFDLNDDFRKTTPMMGCCNILTQNEAIENNTGSPKNIDIPVGKTSKRTVTTSKSKGSSKNNTAKNKQNTAKTSLPDEVQNIIQKKKKITPIRETAIYTEQTELDTNIGDQMEYLKSLKKKNENQENIIEQKHKPVDAIPTGNTTNLLTFYEKKIKNENDGTSLSDDKSKEDMQNELENRTIHSCVPREELLTFLDIFKSFTKLVPNQNVFKKGTTLIQINVIANKAEQLLQRIFEASMRLSSCSIHFSKELKQRNVNEDTTVQTNFNSTIDTRNNSSISESLLSKHDELMPVAISTSPLELLAKSTLPARSFISSKSEPSFKKINSLTTWLDSGEHKLKSTKIPQAHIKMDDFKNKENVSKSKKMYKQFCGKKNKHLMLINKFQNKNNKTKLNLFPLTMAKRKKYRNYLKKKLTYNINKDVQQVQKGNYEPIHIKNAQKHFKTLFDKHFINEIESKQTQMECENSLENLRALKTDIKTKFRNIFPTKTKHPSSRIKFPPIITLPLSPTNYQSLEYFTCENNYNAAEIMNRTQDYLISNDKSFSNINIKDYILCDTPKEKKYFDNNLFPNMSMLKGKTIFSQETKSNEKIEEWISNNLNIYSSYEILMPDDSLINQEELSESKFFSIPSFRTDSNKAYVFYSCSENESSRSPSVNFLEQLKSQKHHNIFKRRINYTIVPDRKYRISSDSSKSCKSREFYLHGTNQITHELYGCHDKEKSTKEKKKYQQKFPNPIKIFPTKPVTHHGHGKLDLQLHKKTDSYKNKFNTNSYFTSILKKNSNKFMSYNKMRDGFYLKSCSNQNKSHHMDSKIQFISKNTNGVLCKNNFSKPTSKTLPSSLIPKPNKTGSKYKIKQKNHSNPLNETTKFDEILIPKDSREQNQKSANSLIKKMHIKSFKDYYNPLKDYFEKRIQNVPSLNVKIIQNNTNHAQANRCAESTFEEKVRNKRVELFKNRIVILKEVLDKLDNAVIVYRKIDTILKDFSCKMSQPLTSSLGDSEKKL